MSGLSVLLHNTQDDSVKSTFDTIVATQLLPNGHDITFKLISLKMNFKELKLSQVLKNQALEGLIYLNILLPPNTHSLLKKARVRKNENSPAFFIYSIQDLNKLP